MAVISICATRSVVANWKPNLRTYRVTYKVTTNDVQDGPAVVMLGLGAVGATSAFYALMLTLRASTYAYGNDADPFAFLIDLGAPRRAGGDKLKQAWLLDAIYEFNSENQPQYQSVRVEPYYVPTQEPIGKAKYKGAFYRLANTWQVAAVGDNGTYEIDKEYMIGNSAKVPILPSPERDASIPAYRVKWTKRTQYNTEQFINRVNSQPFTLQGDSRLFLSPASGVAIKPMFSKTFEPGTLRLRDVQQPIRTIHGEDWYDVTLEFIEDESIAYELDRGFSARADAGDPDGKGGTFSGGDFPEGATAQRELTDENGSPVSEPVLLNGQGQPIRLLGSLGPVYLGWERYEKADFNQLNIGAWQ
jgi:hypothetical protein